MVRKLVCAMAVMVVGVSFILADEFQATITEVKDGKVTFQKYKKGEKGKKGEKDGDPMTLPVSDTLTVAKGKFNQETKKFETGDKLDGGIKNETFTKLGDNGLGVRITTDADNKKITQIVIAGGKKKKTN